MLKSNIRKLILIVNIIYSPIMKLNCTLNNLQENQQALELLISQKNYADACRGLELYLSCAQKIDSVNSMAYVQQKLFDLINLAFANPEESKNWDVDWHTPNIARAIMHFLPEAEARDFAKKVISMICNKDEWWQDTIELTIEELFYISQCPNKELFQFISSLLDNYVAIDPSKNKLNEHPALLLARFSARFTITHNILSCFGFNINDEKNAENYISDLNFVSFGKKYIDEFFSNEERILNHFITHAEALQKMWADANIVDVGFSEDIYDKRAKELISVNPNAFAKLMMIDIANQTASVALSTVLLMKKSEGCRYLSEIYNKFVQHGYAETAHALKLYVLNQPQSEEGNHVIQNPKHVNDENSVRIPQWCKQAFASL